MFVCYQDVAQTIACLTCQVIVSSVPPSPCNQVIRNAVHSKPSQAELISGGEVSQVENRSKPDPKSDWWR
jgi:hypothetical protein